MSNACLVYGVVSAASRWSRAAPPLAGVGGSEVRFVADRDGELAAAVSSITAPSPRGWIDDALAHVRVVEALHAESAVAPMRFGCALSGDGAVAEVLRERRAEFAAVLRAVDGCIEMGVRVLAEDAGSGVRSSAAVPATAAGDSSGAGAAYLARRRAAYVEADRRRSRTTSMSDLVRDALAGRFVAFRAEAGGRMVLPAESRRVLASAYFLVRRDSLDSFCRAFRAFRAAHSTPLLLSGPWPPYNFATPEAQWKPC